MEKRKAVIFGNTVCFVGIIIFFLLAFMGSVGAPTSLSLEKLFQENQEVIQVIERQNGSPDLTLSRQHLSFLLGTVQFYTYFKLFLSIGTTIAFSAIFIAWPAFQSSMMKSDKMMMKLAYLVLLADVLLVLLGVLFMIPFSTTLVAIFDIVLGSIVMAGILIIGFCISIYMHRYYENQEN